MPFNFHSIQQQPDLVITGFTTRDVRFPTSLDQTGSDAMNDVGDYSAAFCMLETDGCHVSRIYQIPDIQDSQQLI